MWAANNYKPSNFEAASCSTNTTKIVHFEHKLFVWLWKNSRGIFQKGTQLDCGGWNPGSFKF
jgi:hypothetical protein